MSSLENTHIFLFAEEIPRQIKTNVEKANDKQPNSSNGSIDQ